MTDRPIATNAVTTFLERGASRARGSRESPSFASQSADDDDDDDEGDDEEEGGVDAAADADAVRIHGLRWRRRPSPCRAGPRRRNSTNDESMMEKEEDGLWSLEEEEEEDDDDGGRGGGGAARW